MKQRVCIAIAISLRPKLIIADEPTSALDVVVQRQVMETLLAVQEELGAAIILIGHDMGLMAQFVDRVGVMYAGNLVGSLRRWAISFASRFIPTATAHRESAIAGGKGVFQGIPGLPPSLLNRPTGCSFQHALPARDGALRPGGAAPARGAGGAPGRVPSLLTSGPRERMTALLEARHVTQGLRRRPLRQGARHGRARRFLVHDRRRAADDHGDRRREWQRQDDAGPPAAGAGGADQRRGALPRQGSAEPLAAEERQRFLRDVQVIFQDPYEVYNPFYKVDHVLDDTDQEVSPGAITREGAAADGGDPARRRSAPGGDAGPAIRTS